MLKRLKRLKQKLQSIKFKKQISKSAFVSESLYSPTSTEQLYQGYIDWVDSEFICGWVYSADKPNEPIEFKLLLEGKELLQNSADLYREDLEKVGFGNGVHGYCCHHDLSAESLVGKVLQLVTLDNTLIGKPFKVPSETPVTISVKKVISEHYLFVFNIEASEAENVTFQLFHNNNRFWQGASTLKKGSNRLELPVCADIVNGTNSTITLGLLGVLGQTKIIWQQELNVSALAVKRYFSLRNKANKPVIVMIDRSIPKPDQDAGSYAAVQEIRLLQALGFHIIFIPDDFTYSPKYTPQLQAMGVEVLFSPYFLHSGDALTSVLPSVSAVYITRYHYVEKHIKTIKAFSTTLPIIFNNADLHFLREIRQANALDDEDLLQNAMKTRDREVKVMKQVDAILSYSEFEHAVITSHILQSKNIHKCPWVVEVPSQSACFNAREGVAFLGGYEHTANVQAVEFFIEQVMPLLREKGEAIKVYIYGSHMPESFYQYACDDVHIKGYVESLDDVYLKHRVFIAPLFFGAGVKGKVLAAAAYGMPCVLSPIAIEATGLVHNVSALVAEHADEWAEYVSRLYFNEQEWNFIAEKQQIMVKESYSFEKAKSMMKGILQSVSLLPKT
ncbi:MULTISPECIES: glycosyltransferase [Colwellia]|uniref:Glycosyl transferase family protein n=1 Tax=Colwellia marinimaniae TaxID=1513592 RepID=A0ABQ0MVT6_9GAMM|nr:MULTISPECIES: glycosyltransferase family 4 protein [Colwellia]GAW95741.1 glycosyl transferase family protein [Colwellia marinimaniae]